MRKLILGMSVSLDGFVAGPNGETEWIFRNRSAESTEWIVDTLGQAGAIAIGSRSYYEMAAFWPYSELPFSPPMNDTPKIIFTQKGIETDTVTRIFAEAAKKHAENPQGVTPTEAVLRSWTDPTVISGDLVEEVARLKEQPGGPISTLGGARFAQSLAAADLIDEYKLIVHPIALGQGLSLFSALPKPLTLRLVKQITFSAGALGLVYEPAR